MGDKIHQPLGGGERGGDELNGRHPSVGLLGKLAPYFAIGAFCATCRFGRITLDIEVSQTISGKLPGNIKK